MMKDSTFFVNARTNTPLGAGETFTSPTDVAIGHEAIVIACKSDQDGTLYVDFSSDDGLNWDSTLSFLVSASINEVHRILVTRPAFRVRYVNGSVAQTYFRLSAIGGQYSFLTSNLNSTIQQDADAVITRSMDFEVALAQGLVQGYSIVNKVGLNPDIDTGTVPEDLWGLGGVYTGWATAAETLQVFSSSALDTAAGTGLRTVRIIGLDANYNIINETVTLNGVTPVVTTQAFIRAHTMSGQSAGSLGVNQGTITVRQSVTTANVMLFMRIGLNQSNDGVYTIPAGYTGYLYNMHACIRGASNATMSAGIWTRAFGSVFRQRRPFSFSQTAQYQDSIFGGLTFTEKTDLTYRTTLSSANNAEPVISFDILLVRNT